MSSSDVNLSSLKPDRLTNQEDIRIGVVVSRWNDDITERLLMGTKEVLSESGIKENNIAIKYVPGAFELPLGAQMMLDKDPSFSAIICLGSIVRGETQHFEFVSNACSRGIIEVSLKYNIPVIFGVLTDDNLNQSIARSGGNFGNKGKEAAVSAINMISFKQSLY